MSCRFLYILNKFTIGFFVKLDSLTNSNTSTCTIDFMVHVILNQLSLSLIYNPNSLKLTPFHIIVTGRKYVRCMRSAVKRYL